MYEGTKTEYRKSEKNFVGTTTEDEQYFSSKQEWNLIIEKYYETT